MKFLIILLVSTFLTSKADEEESTFKRVCYYQKWSQSDGLTPDKVDPKLCTHYIYAFTWVKDGVMVMEEPEDEKRYEQIFTLRQRSEKEIKIMLCMGSAPRNLELSNAVSGEANRTRLVDSIMSFFDKYDFDGLDIDWEFPAWIFNGAPLKDKNNFLLLLKELRERFDANPRRLLLSAAVGIPYTIVKMSYDIAEMAKYVDFVSLMSYGTHNYQWYMPFTGHNTPLFKRRGEILIFATMNTAWAVDYYIRKGMPKSKIIVGLGIYGNGFNLTNPNKYGVGVGANGGFSGPNYREICELLAGGAVREFDNEQKCPYLHKDKIWVSYDDEESLTIKCNWVKENELGGVMTWKLNHDDWKGTCGGKLFPLHNTILDVLG